MNTPRQWLKPTNRPQFIAPKMAQKAGRLTRVCREARRAASCVAVAAIPPAAARSKRSIASAQRCDPTTSIDSRTRAAFIEHQEFRGSSYNIYGFLDNAPPQAEAAMTPQVWQIFARGCVVFVVLCASSTFSAAQPPRPPVPDDGVQPIPQPEQREPGYLGLIADDRREQGAGVRVVRVVEGSPAAVAGIEVNDLITAIDGQAVGTLAAMGAQLEPRAAEDKVRFEVRRAGTTRTIEVALGRRPARGERPFEFGRIPEKLPEPAASSSATAVPPRAGLPPSVPAPQGAAASRGQLLGIRSGPVSEETRVRLGVPEAGGALVVARVVGSPADKAGIPLDAVIVAVDGGSVASPVDLARLIESAGPGRAVELTYFSRGERHTATVTLADVTALRDHFPTLRHWPTKAMCWNRQSDKPHRRQIRPSASSSSNAASAS